MEPVFIRPGSLTSSRLYPVKHLQEPSNGELLVLRTKPLWACFLDTGSDLPPADRYIVWELGRQPFRTHLEHILEKPTLECEVEYR